MISVSGCGFCFSVPARHSFWFPSQDVWFLFQCSYSAFFMISISGCGFCISVLTRHSLWFPSQVVDFVSVLLRGILYDFHLRLGFIRGFVSVAFFVISISGSGFCFSVPTHILYDFHLRLWFLFQRSYSTFFMISISGCGFCFSVPTRHSLWFPSQVVDFVSVFLRRILYDFHLRLWFLCSVFLRGILYDFHLGLWFFVPTRHSLWFPSQVVDFVLVFLRGTLYNFHLRLRILFQCSYAAFFVISISGCGFLFQCSYAAFFVISISGCGFLFFQCSYAACYCEENVYKLCEAVRDNSPASELDKSFAVFVSNKWVVGWFTKK